MPENGKSRMPAAKRKAEAKHKKKEKSERELRKLFIALTSINLFHYLDTSK